MKLIGYACVRTREEDINRQWHMLRAVGCAPVFEDRAPVSWYTASSDLRTALSHIGKGDCLVVTSFDRLGITIRDCFEVVLALQEKDASLKVLDVDIVFSRLLLVYLSTALAMVYRMERVRLREKQLEAIAKAKSEGRFERDSTYIDFEEVRRLVSTGHSVVEIAQDLEVSPRTISARLKSPKISKPKSSQQDTLKVDGSSE